MSEESILDRIVAAKKEGLPYRRQKEPMESLQRRIRQLVEQQEGRGEQWSLKRAILEGPRGPLNGGKRLQIIAEVKKASPSKGRIITDLERDGLPRAYVHSGATAISVLTEEKHFLGDIKHLLETRNNLDGYYPGGRPSLLRKDFLFDPYQIWESRAFGADAVLLIAAILSDDQMRELMALARELEMDSLVEVHNEAEVARAVDVGAEIIGINNRDLRTFQVDLATTERLRPLIPPDRVVVSESGISTRADAERLADCGVHAILVGEALITAPDVKRKVRELLV
jgi:indole-3-glycerol phosphate synthase